MYADLVSCAQLLVPRRQLHNDCTTTGVFKLIVFRLPPLLLSRIFYFISSVRTIYSHSYRTDMYDFTRGKRREIAHHLLLFRWERCCDPGEIQWRERGIDTFHQFIFFNDRIFLLNASPSPCTLDCIRLILIRLAPL